jgi:hypothetical protein
MADPVVISSVTQGAVLEGPVLPEPVQVVHVDVGALGEARSEA